MAVFTAGLDVTAYAVIVELYRRGVTVFRCDPAAFPATLKLGARFSAGWTGHLRSDIRELDLSDVACCWWRRPTPITIARDTPEPEWVRREAVAGLRGVLAALPWLNHPDNIRTAEHKPVQLANAARVGLTVPPTLITNDPAEAQVFARMYGSLVTSPERRDPRQWTGDLHQSGRPCLARRERRGDHTCSNNRYRRLTSCG